MTLITHTSGYTGKSNGILIHKNYILNNITSQRENMKFDLSVLSIILNYAKAYTRKEGEDSLYSKMQKH